MITIYNILQIHGMDPSKVRLVRHGNKEIPIWETFSDNLPRFEAYQSFQNPGKFGDAAAIVVFAPYYGTTALLLGVWDVLGCTENKNFTKQTLHELQRHNLPESWLSSTVRYDLRKNPLLDELVGRLIIEWGAATVAWVQSKDKEVVAIRGKNSIGDFQSFDRVSLDFSALKRLMEFPDANITWVKALSSVNGVYLIKHKTSGKLYVGSAYGDQGIYGRWYTYAKTGHGENQELKGLDPIDFQFSILEIVPATTKLESVIDSENRWKEKLGTREFGLNKN